MAGDRYVLLGLARPRASWFRRVAQWSTSGALPVEFLKCVSVEEVRARLASGRPVSAVLVDGRLPSVDRDLLAAAACPVIVVDAAPTRHDWKSLGAAAVLPEDVERDELLGVLAAIAVLVGRVTSAELDDAPADPPWSLAPVVAVCGTGGTGASTVAAALAQGIDGDVVLADLALRADQAVLHDVRDVAPALQELVDAHRSARPSPEEVRGLTFHVVERHYHLLLGLRSASQWTAVRRRAFEVAFQSLRAAFEVVVCDVTGDLEPEDERTHLAGTAVRAADAVFAVGRPGVKGVHSLVRLLHELAGGGVERERIVPVLNVAPRHPRARAEITSALAELAPGVGAPVFLPERKVEQALRDVVPLPSPLPAALASAYDAVLRRAGSAMVLEGEPELVAPGSLGLA